LHLGDRGEYPRGAVVPVVVRGAPGLPEQPANSLGDVAPDLCGEVLLAPRSRAPAARLRARWPSSHPRQRQENPNPTNSVTIQRRARPPNRHQSEPHTRHRPADTP